MMCPFSLGRRFCCRYVPWGPPEDMIGGRGSDRRAAPVRDEFGDGHEAGLVIGQVAHAVRDRMFLRTSVWDGVARSGLEAVCQLLYRRTSLRK